jgi:hypothetical protein
MKSYYKLYGDSNSETFSKELKPGKKYLLGRDSDSLANQLLLIEVDNEEKRADKLNLYNSAVNGIDRKTEKAGSLVLEVKDNDITISSPPNITYPVLVKYENDIIGVPIGKGISIKDVIGGNKGKVDIYVNRIFANDKHKNYIGSIAIEDLPTTNKVAETSQIGRYEFVKTSGDRACPVCKDGSTEYITYSLKEGPFAGERGLRMCKYCATVYVPKFEKNKYGFEEFVGAIIVYEGDLNNMKLDNYHKLKLEANVMENLLEIAKGDELLIRRLKFKLWELSRYGDKDAKKKLEDLEKINNP